MPGKPKNKRFDLSKRNKEIEEEKLKSTVIDTKLGQLVKENDKKRKRLKRLQNKAKELQTELEEAEKNVTELKGNVPGDPFRMTKRKRMSRIKCPTMLKKEDSQALDNGKSASSVRRKELLEASYQINGATIVNRKPALDGLWITAIRALSGKDLFENSKTSFKMTNVVVPRIANERLTAYEKSDANYLRSINVLYSGGLMSKDKCKSIRLVLAFEGQKGHVKRWSMQQGIKMNALVEYCKLMKYVNQIDMGELKDFKADFCSTSDDDDENIEGAYKDLGYLLPIMAELYLFLHGEGLIDLNWFQNEGMFEVSIGADGAPFGKDDEATAWLLSFANLGKRVSSAHNNFLLCGENASEGCKPMKTYASSLVKEMSYIETKTFNILGRSIQCKFSFIPCDMKWLATFSGEVSNAFYYFSSFGNVSKDDADTINGSLGNKADDTWHPWDYKTRLEKAENVKNYKKKLEEKNYKPSTERDKTLKFMKEEETHQEFKPILGELIDNAYAEPLHNTSNAWQQYNNLLLKEAINKSQFPSNAKVGELPEGNVFRKFVYAIKNDVKANCVFKKIRKWFNNGMKGTFEYRFTGKDSKAYCHKFMHLVVALKQDDDKENDNLRLHVFSFLGVQLREAVSLFSRVDPPEDYLEALKQSCQLYFNCHSLFLGSVTPTLWTIGYAVPYHAKLIFDRYSLGLGLATMQGREAKHTILATFAKHASRALRWSLIFRHEFINFIWLRHKFPKSPNFTHKVINYTPAYIYTPNYCFCGLEKDQEAEMGTFCHEDNNQIVTESCFHGMLSDQAKTLLSCAQ